MNRLRTLMRALALATLLSLAPPALAQDSGLPAGMGVPRTLRSYTHVFVAFGVAWVLLFGYTVSISRRFGRLEEELEQLKKG